MQQMVGLYRTGLVLLVTFAGLSTAIAQSRDAVLWRPVDVATQDTFAGPGGEAGRPDLSRVTFIREEKGGYSKKYRIRDASGRVWIAKIGKEAQSETAAVRLLSALGYQTEVNYLVSRLTIPQKGTFTNVRLEARPENVERREQWRWDRNPFTGTHQLAGLKIMMAFLNNWDMKNANNVVLETDGRHHYVISDLGVSFGKTGAAKFALLRWIGRSRNEPRDYARAKFITGVRRDGRVKFHFNGKNHRELDRITLEDARWLADRLTRLTDRQIREAFRAANYSPAEIDLLTRAVKDRIAQLDRIGNGQRLANTR
jgi:hypothetical protein